MHACVFVCVREYCLLLLVKCVCGTSRGLENVAFIVIESMTTSPRHSEAGGGRVYWGLGHMWKLQTDGIITEHSP